MSRTDQTSQWQSEYSIEKNKTTTHEQQQKTKRKRVIAKQLSEVVSPRALSKLNDVPLCGRRVWKFSAAISLHVSVCNTFSIDFFFCFLSFFLSLYRTAESLCPLCGLLRPRLTGSNTVMLLVVQTRECFLNWAQLGSTAECLGHFWGYFQLDFTAC